MKITKRKVTASTDYRTFDGFRLDEVEEMFPDIYYDYFYDIRNDVEEVYISRDPECEFVGALDTDGMYLVYKKEDPDFGPGWFEVTFEELAEYLKQEEIKL